MCYLGIKKTKIMLDLSDMPLEENQKRVIKEYFTILVNKEGYDLYNVNELFTVVLIHQSFNKIKFQLLLNISLVS